MNRTVKTLAVLAGGIAGLAGGTAMIGNFLWKRETGRAFDDLGPAPAASETPTFSPDALAGLPAPVVRYFQFALTPGRPVRSRFNFEQDGEFRAGGFDAGWSPFTAEQRFSVRPPGFVWDARIRMAPLVAVRVRDSYLHGTGSMRGRAAGVLPVVDQTGTPEIAAGALHRYLAEAVWFPTALLPGNGVTWEPIDDRSARATLADGPTTVSLDFRFAESGEIVEAYTPARLRDVNGTGVPTPWLCSYRSYAEVEGMKIPSEGEVAWILPEGKLSYWRGKVRLRSAR
jgi:hypothetical protein